MRTNKTPPKWKYFDLKTSSLNKFFNKMYGDQYGEYVCGDCGRVKEWIS